MQFWIQGNNISIIIGEGSSFVFGIHFCAQQDNCRITIGKDCQFSNTITLRTSDSHPIYDLNTNKRVNSPKSITIGDHVWIAPQSLILKGVNIGNGSIIGSHSVVTHNVPANVLAVGMPAKVVKENVYWTRESLF